MSEQKELATIIISVSDTGELSVKVAEPKEVKLQKRYNIKAKKNETVYVKPDEGFDGLSEVQVAPLKLRSRYVSPTTVNQEIKAGDGFDGLDLVQISAIHLQDKTVTPTNKMQIITADEPYDGLGSVIVSGVSGDNNKG